MTHWVCVCVCVGGGLCLTATLTTRMIFRLEWYGQQCEQFQVNAVSGLSHETVLKLLKSDSVRKAEILNHQFKSVFTKEDTTGNIHRHLITLWQHPQHGKTAPSQTPTAITSIRITVTERSTEESANFSIWNVRPDKATGPDSIPAFLLKTAAAAACYSTDKDLSSSSSLAQWRARYSSDWNWEARVVPIFREGRPPRPTRPANYRPLSIPDLNHMQSQC